jgi:hypothetical protein
MDINLDIETKIISYYECLLDLFRFVMFHNKKVKLSQLQQW